MFEARNRSKYLQLSRFAAHLRRTPAVQTINLTIPPYRRQRPLTAYRRKLHLVVIRRRLNTAQNRRSRKRLHFPLSGSMPEPLRGCLGFIRG